MKKPRILSLALALCLCLALMPAAAAAEDDLGEITRAEAEERFGITISPAHIDFGTLYQDESEPVEYVTLTNNGDVPVMIRGFYKEFDFTPAEADRALSASLVNSSISTVDPGESVRFKVTLLTDWPGSELSN